MNEAKTGVEQRIGRRAFLKGSALAGFGAFLAACAGTSSQAPSAPASINVPTPPPASPSPSVAPSATPKPAPTGPLKWAQWPAYIDLVGKAADLLKYLPGSSPTLEAFKKQYNVDVDYEEKIQANETFLATIRPQLVAGAPTGWDMVTVTDWLAAKLISKGWIEKIDQSNVPNCVANLREPLKNQVSLLGKQALSKIVPKRLLQREQSRWVARGNLRVNLGAGFTVHHLHHADEVKLARAN